MLVFLAWTSASPVRRIQQVRLLSSALMVAYHNWLVDFPVKEGCVGSNPIVTAYIEEWSNGTTLGSEPSNGGSIPSSSAYVRESKRLGSCLQNSLSRFDSDLELSFAKRLLLWWNWQTRLA